MIDFLIYGFWILCILAASCAVAYLMNCFANWFDGL